MPTIENKSYGSGYAPCSVCGVLDKELNAGHCAKCVPQRACAACNTPSDLVLVAGSYVCRDADACFERFWRVAAKAADLVHERELMQTRGRALCPDPVYLHHNADCDYHDGQWICPEPCSVSDPPYEIERDRFVWPD